MIDEIHDPKLEKWLGKRVEVFIELVCTEGEAKSLTVCGVMKKEPFGYIVEDEEGSEFLVDSGVILNIAEV